MVETTINMGDHSFSHMEEDVDRQRLLGTPSTLVADPQTQALTTDLQKKQRSVPIETFFYLFVIALNRRDQIITILKLLQYVVLFHKCQLMETKSFFYFFIYLRDI